MPDGKPKPRRFKKIPRKIVKPILESITHFDDGACINDAQSLTHSLVVSRSLSSLQDEVGIKNLLQGLIFFVCYSRFNQDEERRSKLFDSVFSIISNHLDITPLRERDLFRYKGLLENLFERPITFDTSFKPVGLPQSISYNLSIDNIPAQNTTSKEFENVQHLGQGGFGIVFKAQKKLDLQIYAIKQIPIHHSSKSEILSEVLILSRLNHPNIVRYHNSWISDETEFSDLQSSSSALCFSNGDCCSFIHFQNTHEDEAQNNETDDGDNYSNTEASVKNSKFPLKYLNIQMELCSENLREWLDRRNFDHYTPSVDEIVNKNIFKQILKGVKYIHSENFIHRDLKPRNIFFFDKEKQVVKIADFGLACKYCIDDKFGANNQKKSDVGTHHYISPEMKTGSYDQKTDIYSLGIILFELYVPFQTLMEKEKILTDLKNSKIDSNLSTLWADQMNLVKKMIHINPEMRPNAIDILMSKLFLSESEIISEQKKLIEEQKIKIKILSERLAKKRSILSRKYDQINKLNVTIKQKNEIINRLNN